MSLHIQSWITPITCGLVFFVHLYLLASNARSFLYAIRNDEAMLKAIQPARFESIPHGKAFRWLLWLSSQANDSGLAPLARLEAANELDASCYNRFDYAFVSRSREYAPFIGLILTAFATLVFYLTEGSRVDLSKPEELVRSILPLLMGVAIGAILGIISSATFQLISMKAAGFRQAAMVWFDEASRHARQAIANDATARLVSEMERTNTALSEKIAVFLEQTLEKANQFQKGGELLQQSALNSSRAAEEAAAVSKQAVISLEKSLTKLCIDLDENINRFVDVLSVSSKSIATASYDYKAQIESAMSQTLELGKTSMELEAKILSVAKSSGKLEEVTAIFRDTIGPAASAIQSAALKYTELTSSLLESSSSIKTASSQLGYALSEHSKNMIAMDHLASQVISPISDALLLGSSSLEMNVTMLNEKFSNASIEFAEAKKTFMGLSETVRLFDDSIRSVFVPSVKSVEDLPTSVEVMGKSAHSLSQSLLLASQALKVASEQSMEQFQDATRSIGNLGGLTESANKAISDFNRTSSSFSSIIDNLTQTSDLLHDVNSGLAPVAVQLSEFLSSMGAVGVLRQDMDELSSSLERVNKIALTAAKAQQPIAEVTSALTELQSTLIDISAKRPGIWGQILSRLKIQ